jgi:DNA-binding NtrC family response regulator
VTQSEKIILLVDDEERLLDSISKRISLLGFTPLKATSGAQALETARQTHIDLAIVDLKMPDMDGLVTITKLKEILPDLKTILLTGYGSEKIKQATESLGSLYVEKDAMGGLWDIIRHSGSNGKVVIIKPAVMDSKTGSGKMIVEQVEVHDAVSSSGYPPPKNEPASLKNERTAGQLPRIIGETPVMQRLKKNIHRLSEMDCAIIIKGEIGTGKELVARTIHYHSPRKNQKFLAFDCGCFSDDFHFSELVEAFHESSSKEDKKYPSFSGTIFLDHIENMPKQIQQEMIQLLDGKNSSTGQALDIRFIVVAYKRLKEKVAKGTFQKELYQRIQAIELEVPALRQRLDDLPLLCTYFLNQYSREHEKELKTISEEAFHMFKAYPFPGNIRELKTIIEHAVILSDIQMIQPEHLPEKFSTRQKEIVPEDQGRFLTIQEMEHQHILKAIKATGGNKSKAAQILGISRAALWRKLRIISQNT